jgi:anti-sigma regulatory factor (Ser/Thr protein kinase)
LDSQRGQHLVLAVNEAVSNVIRHGGGRGRLMLRRDDSRALVVEISDDGPGMPPNPALTAPPAGQPGGRGLYLIKKLCDRVEFRSGPAGTTVRLEMNLHAG